MTVVAVDFNNVGRGGLIRSHLRRASGHVRAGDRVQAVDAPEDMSFPATVESVEDSGRLWLDVDYGAEGQG